MDIFQTFLSPNAWMALLTLTFLEIVLSIDNVVFLSIMTGRLPQKQQPRARVTGLFFAMLARIGLLFCISLLMRMKVPFHSFHYSWLSGELNLQSLIVLAGGVFLLFKSVSEIHGILEGHKRTEHKSHKKVGFWSVIIQIVAIDVVLSLDSVMTAVGMVSFRDFGYDGAMVIMVIAIVISVLTMMLFSGPIARFVNGNPAIQMLALSFMILVGVMLLTEASYLADLRVFGKEITEIPKGYIYFAIAFSLLVEMLNMMASRRKKRKSKA